MAFFTAAVAKDLRRLRADPGAMALWLGIPVIIGALMHVAMGGAAGPQPVAHLLLVDEDQTWFTELLAGAASGSAGGMLEVESLGRPEAEAAIANGEGSALLILPAGFSAALLTGAPSTLELITNPAQRILPGILQEGLELFTELAFYAQELLGEPLQELASSAEAGSDFSQADVARIAVELQERFEGLGQRLFPPAIDLEAIDTSAPVESDGGSEPALQPSFSSLYFPGLVYMGLLFACMGLSLDLWREREMGTLRRALAAPCGARAFLGAKLVAGSLLLAAVCSLGIAVGIAAYGYPWSSYLPAVLWSSFTGAAFLAVFFGLQGFSRSERGGNVMASMLIFPLIMLGGSFFPFEAMPEWMASIGRWTPNGLAVEELKQILLRSEPTGRRAIALLVLAGAAAASLLLLSSHVRREEGAGA